jgi:phosphatidylserine/phosphatidylglycerophosphate/cardiolipin synthase-like enzyme
MCAWACLGFDIGMFHPGWNLLSRDHRGDRRRADRDPGTSIFTSAPILGALVRAKRLDIDIAVILDKSNQWQGYSGATFVAHAGIPVWIDHPSGIAHNKVIVIDRHMVVGGSMNYTKAATYRNAENVTFIESPDVAAWFLANWTARQTVSSAYTPLN